MIEFITTKKNYLNEKQQLYKVFKNELDLINNSFTTDFSLFMAFEFDIIYNELFYDGLVSLLNSSHDKEFTFYTLDPNPDKYFFKHFSKYSIGKVPVSSSYSDFIEFLDRDPGDSPADALLYNSETIAIYPNNLAWSIIGSKELEIGIVGFKTPHIQNKFLNHFENNSFTSLRDRIDEILDLLKLKWEDAPIYSKLLKMYSQGMIYSKDKAYLGQSNKPQMQNDGKWKSYYELSQNIFDENYMIYSKLDFLKRKNKGKFLGKEYKEIFVSAGLDDLEYIVLEESDNLLSRIREIFPVIQEQFEILPDNITVFDSKLLMKAFSNVDYCYVYSDDVYYCGMYLTNSRFAQQYCLNIAKLYYSNTCFILDKDLKFSIRINFYNEDHNEYKNKFDIQLKQK